MQLFSLLVRCQEIYLGALSLKGQIFRKPEVVSSLADGIAAIISKHSSLQKCCPWQLQLLCRDAIRQFPFSCISLKGYRKTANPMCSKSSVWALGYECTEMWTYVPRINWGLVGSAGTQFSKFVLFIFRSTRRCFTGDTTSTVQVRNEIN